MGTTKLTDQRSVRVAELPEDYRVIGVNGTRPDVRKPTGQIIRQQNENGSLTEAAIAARRRLTDRRADHAGRLAGGVQAVTPYTSVRE